MGLLRLQDPVTAPEKNKKKAVIFQN